MAEQKAAAEEVAESLALSQRVVVKFAIGNGMGDLNNGWIDRQS